MTEPQPAEESIFSVDTLLKYMGNDDKALAIVSKIVRDACAPRMAPLNRPAPPCASSACRGRQDFPQPARLDRHAGRQAPGQRLLHWKKPSPSRARTPSRRCSPRSSPNINWYCATLMPGCNATPRGQLTLPHHSRFVNPCFCCVAQQERATMPF
jgi:hypothetical protein